MNKFQHFTQQLKQRLMMPLPGRDAQEPMVPPTREKAFQENKIPEKAKLSAVLILFYPVNDEIRFVLIERAIYNGVHSGQIAFPGGQYVSSDKDLQTTALREAQEEINIDPEKVTIAGQLTPVYIPPSHFDVYPFVGYCNNRPPLQADQTETKEVLEIRLDDLMNPENQTQRTIWHRTGKPVLVPCFLLNNKIVWGATAMILSELYALLKERE
ncbi:CoA pyrophosphatase [Candidatus Sulfidibacterium hydrothermale]|uniref:NUDIX hydrolase n=1 Tax=Candidatus Sulfidibacterium hydrothermale TaxID=2875962 RepID=UPI001F0B5CE4|nr:CoA pyrophosphatase [Candidatus Sulfidibacterium hydrothermale]UBM63478.1 CoA pyrophosphatase [Candidatus Sulfidibacterium hydrothermale]